MPGRVPMLVFPSGLQKWSFLVAQLIKVPTKVRDVGSTFTTEHHLWVTEWLKLRTSLGVLWCHPNQGAQGHFQSGFQRLPGQGQPVPASDDSGSTNIFSCVWSQSQVRSHLKPD